MDCEGRYSKSGYLMHILKTIVHFGSEGNYMHIEGGSPCEYPHTPSFHLSCLQDHQPIIFFLCLSKSASSSGFVNMSAICSPVATWYMLTVSFLDLLSEVMILDIEVLCSGSHWSHTTHNLDSMPQHQHLAGNQEG